MGDAGHRLFRPADTTRRGQACDRLPLSLVRPILLISMLHAGLCVWFHYQRAWLFDEWASYLALDDTYRNLLSHFGGQRTMNFYLAWLKAIHEWLGGTNWLLVLPGILCGTWLVWLVAALALSLGSGPQGAIIGALLVAVNPCLVRYSVTIRSYIFLATFSAAVMLWLLGWRQTGRWREGILCGIFGGLALLVHLNAVYTLVAAGALALCWTIARARRAESGWLRKFGRFVIPVASCAALAGAAYIPQLADLERFRAKWFDTPPIPLTFLPTVLGTFFGGDYLLLPTLVILLYAAWHSCRNDRESQWLLLAVIVVLSSISLAGVSHYPQAYARFTIMTLPWLVLLIADGIASIWERWRMAGTAIVIVLIVGNLVALANVRANQHAYPWHLVAQYVRQEMAAEGRCVVVGGGHYNAAMQVYGVRSSADVVEVLSGLAVDEPTHLIVVVVASGFNTTPPAREFGSLRVITVAGTPRRIAAELLRQMIAGAKGRVADELVDVYQQIGGLLRWTGRPDAATKYDLLGNEGKRRGYFFRHRPAQFLRNQSSGAAAD
jgi:hypothetical protein